MRVSKWSSTFDNQIRFETILPLQFYYYCTKTHILSSIDDEAYLCILEYHDQTIVLQPRLPYMEEDHSQIQCRCSRMPCLRTWHLTTTFTFVNIKEKTLKSMINNRHVLQSSMAEILADCLSDLGQPKIHCWGLTLRIKVQMQLHSTTQYFYVLKSIPCVI